MMLPKKLDDLDEFPLNTLLDHLDNPRFIEEMTLPKHCYLGLFGYYHLHWNCYSYSNMLCLEIQAFTAYEIDRVE